MRLWMTGGTGFVGSNIMMAALGRGHDVLTTVNAFTPPADAAYRIDQVDMTDSDAVAASVRNDRPDMIVHCAILNDIAALYRDRAAGWEAYVGATRATLDAATAADVPYVLISTDWVYDGTQHLADEETPPAPVNLYGMYKFASEMVTLERGGAVARVSGVNGLHRCRPDTPRSQDPGYGYFVASLVDALSRGDSFTVWESDEINMLATPSLASETAEMILDIGEQGLDGVFHCCGADAVGRMELAHLACDVFDLDPSLVVSGPPVLGDMAGIPIPHDTSLSRPRTTDVLGRPGTPVRGLLERFRSEYESAA